ncbi:hypothetical protein CIB84_000849 [Bambusicola thoracicus]|uniref:Soluble lamin-associated protein of 75 kDa n=1 Tax=Bambusicola thoracicus TaxID=9083 RepID=A0A2P4TGB3_BAMTH|nr:hypothetical protein CIB84_000849 [Bambusicola thoracicus]
MISGAGQQERGTQEIMAFPVDMLNGYTHEDLEKSAEDYLSELRCGDPNQPEFLSLSDHRKVNSVGERVVLYVLNRIIYRKNEMERNETPFLCHSSDDYAKIMWRKGEAVGFYSVKPAACKHYFEKYPGDNDLLFEVEGSGFWFQRKSIATILQRKELIKSSQKANVSFQTADHLWQSAANELKTDPETQLSADSQKDQESSDDHASTSEDLSIAQASIRTRSSHLKRPKTGKNSQESGPEISQGDEENAPHTSAGRPELPTRTSKCLEAIEEESEVDVESGEEMITSEEDQSVLETELHTSPSEKLSEKEGTPSESLNGEVAEETSKTVAMAEEEAANEVLGESKLQSENQEEPLTLLVPLILESPTKPSEGAVSEKVLNANDSEGVTEESASVERKGIEEDKQESEEKKSSTEDVIALTPKEELSNNGLPNSIKSEAVEETVSETAAHKPASSVEDQSEEAEQNSQEASVALGQSSLIVVELEGVSLQQPSGQEGQKKQTEEHLEESAEQTEQFTQIEQYTQTAAERAADSSSEEAEIEVPVVDRRNLRRKAKGYKGPPKKKGKPA